MKQLGLPLVLLLAVTRPALAQSPPVAQSPAPQQMPSDSPAPTRGSSPTSTTTPIAAEPPKPPAPTPPATAALQPPFAGPWAGYGDGTFFLRDPKEWMVLYPKGRLNVDGYTFPNRGDAPMGVVPNSPQDPRPRNTIFIRRARAELQGTFLKHWDFTIAGEWANVPATGSFGSVTDAFVICDYLPYLKAQVGQFDAPFTMENRTSDKYIDFMERSLAVRAFGVPTNKELGGMLWGWLPNNVAYYSVGVFNGDGQNFRNQDSNPAVLGRAFVQPFVWLPAAKKHWFLRDIWVGASFWWQKNNNIGSQAAPNFTGIAQDDEPPMTTQGGVAFFNPSFGNGQDSAGNAVRSHLVPGNRIVKWALEANVPVWSKAGLRFEYVHQNADLAMYNDTNPMGVTIVRAGPLNGGKLDGYGMYLEAWGWILGDNHFIETPGIEPFPRLKTILQPSPRWGLMLLAKYERLEFDISNLPTTATAMGPVANPAQGHYLIQAFELGLNAWATKHIRLTVNYILNHFDGDSTQMKGNYYFGRNDHELLFRVGANL